MNLRDKLTGLNYELLVDSTCPPPAEIITFKEIASAVSAFLKQEKKIKPEPMGDMKRT